jgi:hypothetical protein
MFGCTNAKNRILLHPLVVVHLQLVRRGERRRMRKEARAKGRSSPVEARASPARGYDREGSPRREAGKGRHGSKLEAARWRAAGEDGGSSDDGEEGH